MDGRFNNPYGINQEDSENLSDNSGDHLPFSVPEGRLASSTTSSQKRSRRAVQKRVVTLPIGDVDGARIKGDGAPPYDSWAWRKYGQKPIKGSPYPRGYYRCSSSKGCPARKQVERSRVDPTMLVITYACDHNHSGPPSRNPSSTTTITTTTAATATKIASPKSEPDESAIFTTQTDSDEKFTDLGADEPLIASDDGFAWFSEVASTSETTTRVMDLLESPIYSGTSNEDVADDVAMIFPMGEEDESLFADLGELPECSVVFSRGFLDQEKRRRCSLRAG